MNQEKSNKSKNVEILEKDVKTSMLKIELDEAAKVQPCPACKEDIEQLTKFTVAKIDAIKTNSKVR